MKIKQILIASAALLAFAACQPAEEAEVSAVSFGSESVKVSANGDVVSVPLKANCNWTAAADASWIQLAPASGSASTASLNVKVDLNETGADRSGVVTVSSVDGLSKAELTVNQGGVIESDSDISTADKFTSFLSNAINATESDVFNILADIDMEGAEIEPAATFAGVLEGNGHKIYNYKVVSKQATSALFLTNRGTISNLILGSSDGTRYDGTSVVTFDDAVTATSNVGGVAAVNSGTIKNVKNFAKIVVKNANTDLAGIGGIAGFTETASTVEECENAGDFQLSGATGAELYVGGIVAYVNNADALIKKCVNSGTIDFPFANTKAIMIGGIVGRANLGATLEECENRGPVSFTQPTATTSGTYIMISGVAGALYTGAKALNCVNNADVTSSRMQVSRIGGIVGTLNSRGNVEGCVNNGNITIDQPGPNDNWQAAGGIVGFEEKQNDGNVIKGNTNNGNISVKVENLTTHNNKVAAGGILGCGVLGLEIEENINNGAVSIVNKAAGPAYAGGITGWMRGEPNYMKNNVNKGAVSCATSDNAAAYAGGVVGAVSGVALAKSNGTLEGDKNEGTVTCANAAGSGSIAGFNGGTLTSCVSGGTVNGTVIDDNNFAGLAVGTNIGAIVDLKSPSGGTAVINVLKASPVEIKVEADAISASFDVESNVEWTVACTAEWIKSFTASGKENGTVEIAFDANESKEAAREATFTVTAEGVDPVTVKLTQNKVASFEGIISDAKTFSMFLEEAALIAETTTVEVTADIDLEGATIEPVSSFAGILDGNGHKIYNFKVVSSSATTGLFLVNNGTIKDLVFGSKDGQAYDGVSEIGAVEGKGGYFTGLIAENNGTLEKITTFATVNFVAATASGETGVSCLVGHAGANSVIKDCVNKATLKASGNVPQVTDFGTIAGYMDKAEARIVNCINESNVVITLPVKKVLHIGGLVGRINAVVTVENCQNKADVIYNQVEAPSTWMSIGGVIGSDYNGGTVSGCSNTGAVSANTLQVVRIGGIMGVLNKSGVVKNCTNEGTVTLTQEANANWQVAGGIIGFQEASQNNDKDNVISGNTNKGAVTVNIENTTTHANKVGVGGILGMGCLALSVTDNTNTAPVSVTNKAAGPIYVGGIYGALIKNKAAILSSGNINTGTVSAATSDNAKAMAGGVVGYVAPGSGSDANTVVLTLSGEKSTGAVTCANTEMVGAIAGNNGSATLENCIAGGSVNGQTVTEGNVSALVQGSASEGTVSGVTFAAN